MSAIVTTSTAKWFWTDDLARALVDAGHVPGALLDGWVSTPVAIRGEGDPLSVAEALLSADQGRIAAA